MSEQVRLTVAVDRDARDAIEEIAGIREQSIDEFVGEAIRARIEREREWEDAVRKGLADIEAGRTISHEEYLAHADERRRRWIAGRQA